MIQFDLERPGHLTLLLAEPRARGTESLSSLAREDKRRRKEIAMQVEVFHGAGIDVHKETAVVTVRHHGVQPTYG